MENITGHGGHRQGAGRPAGAIRSDHTERFNKARADKEEQSAILKKLEVQEALSELKKSMGDLVPREEVERGFAVFVNTVVMMLNTLPDIVERDAGISGESVARIHSALDKVRRELSVKLEAEFRGS